MMTIEDMKAEIQKYDRLSESIFGGLAPDPKTKVDRLTFGAACIVAEQYQFMELQQWLAAELPAGRGGDYRSLGKIFRRGMLTLPGRLHAVFVQIRDRIACVLHQYEEQHASQLKQFAGKPLVREVEETLVSGFGTLLMQQSKPGEFVLDGIVIVRAFYLEVAQLERYARDLRCTNAMLIAMQADMGGRNHVPWIPPEVLHAIALLIDSPK